MRNKYNQLQKHIRRDGFSANPELANMIDNMLQHGFALDSAGQIEQAKSIYEAILKLNPKHFHALQLLGAIAVQTQQWDKALKLLTDALAINNTSASVYNNRGIVLQELKRLEEALASYNKAIEYKRDFIDAYSNRGIVLQELKRYEEALVSYDKAIGFKHDFAEAYYNRGIVLNELKRKKDALLSYEKAIEFKRDFAEAYLNRGIALKEINRFEDSLASYDKSIEFKHNYAEAYSNRGNVLKELMRLEEALLSYDKAIEIDSDHAEAYYNRGVVLKTLKRFEESLACYDKAIELNLEYNEAHWNKSLLLLTLGDFENGWKLYAYRWKYSLIDSYRNFKQPLWLGDNDISHKTILIHAEQGLGDTLQFIRYVPMVAALGATVMVEVQAPLLSLFLNMQGISVLLKQGDSLPPFDVHCPMMSLPLAFKTTLDTVPACPQFVIPEAKTQFWSDKLGSKAIPRVGLVWNGGFRPDQPEIWDVNERRNLPLQQLKALVGIDVEFISLQKGEPAESEFRQTVASGWDGPVIHDHVIELKDFSDTAALVMNLDLVIAVDTSTAHLAASIGKPVWLLNRYDTCWRWLVDREDSPWYPSIKIYRQTSSGDWDSVLQKVRIDLLSFATSFHR